MLSGEDIQRNIQAAWRLMFGGKDGLDQLDLSADGFWDSFMGIALALPPMALSWVMLTADPAIPLGNFSIGHILAALAVIDLAAWVAPLIVFTLAAPRMGLAGRIVPYVVATNWSGAILSWMLVPASLARLFFPNASDFGSLLGLGLFFLAQFLSWRVTTYAINRGPAVGTAVFAAMFVLSLAVIFPLQALFGISAVGG